MIYSFMNITREMTTRRATKQSDYYRIRMAMLGIKNDLAPDELKTLKSILKDEYDAAIKTLNK